MNELTPTTWSAHFHDGRTPTRHRVEARLGPDGLEILRAPGERLAVWAYASLASLEPLRADRPAVLTQGPEDDARLTLSPPPDFAALIARAPQLGAGALARARSTILQVVVWTAVTAALGASLWFGWPYAADMVAAVIPSRVETLIAGQARTQMLDQGKLCESEPAQAVLDRLVARLTEAMPYDRPVKVMVVDIPLVNAFALPGDQIMLFQKLVAEAESPEEFAAVLAHEIGHLAEHHPMRGLVRQFGLALLVSSLSGSSSWDTMAQYLLSSAYTRAFEQQADARALDTLRNAEIGGQGWVDFFGRHAGKAGGWDRAIAYLSTHPPSAERSELAARLPPTGKPIMSAGDWLVLKSICAKATAR